MGETSCSICDHSLPHVTYWSAPCTLRMVHFIYRVRYCQLKEERCSRLRRFTHTTNPNTFKVETEQKINNKIHAPWKCVYDCEIDELISLTSFFFFLIHILSYARKFDGNKMRKKKTTTTKTISKPKWKTETEKFTNYTHKISSATIHTYKY